MAGVQASSMLRSPSKPLADRADLVEALVVLVVELQAQGPEILLEVCGGPGAHDRDHGGRRECTPSAQPGQGHLDRAAPDLVGDSQHGVDHGGLLGVGLDIRAASAQPALLAGGVLARQQAARER